MARNIYKIGSRWSNTGDKDKSILDIFDKHRIVFAGKKIDKIKTKVKIGDLIAISDGLQIVRIGQVLSVPTKITDFTMFGTTDKKRFNYNEKVIGFRVEMFELHKDEFLETQMGTFHKIKKNANAIEELYNHKILTSS